MSSSQVFQLVVWWLWSCYFFTCDALDDLPTGFFQNIDGISLGITSSHLCSIESKPGVEMGGTAACWGFDVQDILFVPKNEIFVQIIVSRYFGCGITLDQYVRCWGENAPKVGGLYTQITASDNFACGVLVDGRVNCWGSYSFPLPSSEKKFVQISCGSTHCCALDPRGLAHCWGWRTVGPIVSYDPPLAELFTDENGNQYFRTNKELTVSSSTYDADEEEEATLPRHQPTLVPIQFKQISVGTHYACGIQYMDGKIRCWGNLKSILKGTDLVDLNAPYRQVSVGNSGVCMISEDTNHVSCLGIAPLSESTEWDQIKVGYYHVCGVTMDSELKCSGPAHPIVNSLRDDFVVA